MYSDRRGGGRGGRDGFGGGGGGYSRGGGGYGDQGYQQRSWGGRDSSGSTTEVFVDQRHVGRIIGKGGSKIRELQETSGANIKVNSREVEDGKVRIALSGSEDCCAHAEDLIKEITEYFNDGGYSGGGGGGGRGGGGGGGGGWGRRDEGGYEGGGRRTCYKCGGEGHMARDCTSADSYQHGSSPRKSSGCYRCGEEGHMARDCQGAY